MIDRLEIEDFVVDVIQPTVGQSLPIVRVIDEIFERLGRCDRCKFFIAKPTGTSGYCEVTQRADECMDTPADGFCHKFLKDY